MRTFLHNFVDRRPSRRRERVRRVFIGAAVVVSFSVASAGKWYAYGTFQDLCRQQPQARSDEYNYWRVAGDIAGGKAARDSVGGYVSYRSVIFPALGAPLVAVLGNRAETLLWLRGCVFLCGATVPLLGFAYVVYVYRDTARWLRACMALVLLSWNSQLNQVSFSFMPDVPGTLLLLLCLFGVVATARASRSRPLLAIGTGVLGGIAALVKFDLMYTLGIVLLVALASSVWHGGRRSRRRASGRPRPTTPNLLLLLGGMALVLAAYAARNAYHVGRPFITSKDTVNLWIGNNPDAVGKYQWRDEWRALRRPGELESRASFRAAVTKYIRTDFKRFLRGLCLKSWRFMTNVQFNLFPAIGSAGMILSYALTFLMVPFSLGVLLAPVPDGARFGLRLLAGAYLVQMMILIAVFVEYRFLTINLVLACMLVPCLVYDLIHRLVRTAVAVPSIDPSPT